jgi:P-type Cu+ transporter
MMEKKTYDVVGMHCVSCSMAISKLLKKNKDIADVEVYLSDSKLVVTLDETKVSDQLIADTVGRLGYRAKPASNEK